MKELNTYSLSKTIAMKAILVIFIFTCLSNHIYGAIPVITYSNQKALTIGTPITISPSSGGTITSTSFEVTTYTGSTLGDVIGTLAQSQYESPRGLLFGSDKILYIADAGNNKIKNVSTSSTVSVVAGMKTAGYKDATGIAAQFNAPTGVARDASGYLYIADNLNNRIRKISPMGVVTTLAGCGTEGYLDGSGATAKFKNPVGVAVDQAGNVFVTDKGNNCIRKIATNGYVTTLAGDGTAMAAYYDNGGTDARFALPEGIVIDANEDLYIADTGNNRIRKVAQNGEVTTVAGNGNYAYINSTTALNASFKSPSGLALDAAGNLYIVDSENHAIRKLSTTGEVTTVAGTGTAGLTDGHANAAQFNYPMGIAVNNCGIIYVADRMNNRIRKISEYGYRISPALPAGLTFNQSTGVISGTPTSSTPLTTYTVTAVNSDGGNSTTIALKTAPPCTAPLFSYEAGNYTFEKEKVITPVTPLTGGGEVPSTGNETSTLTSFGFTTIPVRIAHGMVMDAQKNIYITDQNTNTILQIKTDGSFGTYAGNGTSGSNSNCKKEFAQFNTPTSLAIDKDGNIFVADYGNSLIREIDKDGFITDYASTFAQTNRIEALAFSPDNTLYAAGNGTLSYFDSKGIAKTVASGIPDNVVSMVVDNNQNVFLAQSGGTQIFKVDSHGNITTYAGSATSGLKDGKLLDATFSVIFGIAADLNGNMYVTDRGYGIRKISGNNVSTLLKDDNVLSTTVDGCGRINYWLVDTKLTDKDKILTLKPMGYIIAPLLPAGLKIDNATGVISGTPTQTSVKTLYTVTALNDCSCNSQSFYLTVTGLTSESRFIGGYGHGDHEADNLPGSGPTNYFDNGGGGFRLGSGNHKWSNIHNWRANQLPTSTEDAYVKADAEVDSIFTHANLIIQNGGSVTILASDTVPISQTKAKSCALTITGSVSGTAASIVDGKMKYNLKICSGAGKTNGSLIFHNPADKPVVAEVEMYSKAVYPRWQFFGVPVRTVDYDKELAYSLICGYHVDDLPSHWDWLSGSFKKAQLTAFNSYAIAEGADTYSFKGQLVNNDMIISLKYKNNASYPDNYLIGNSYTAAINIKKMAFTKTSNTVYLYNTGSYKEWESYYPNKQTGNSPGQYLSVPQLLAGTPPLPATIPSMQAFLVLAKEGTVSDLSIPYSATTVNMARYNEIQRTKAEINYSSTIIDIWGECFSDLVCLFTIPNTTKKFDNGYDGDKILGPETCPQLFAREKCGDYQVNSVDNIDSTLLCFRAGTDQVYTLNFTHYNLSKYYDKLYLQDLVENSITDITPSGTEYKFTDDNPEIHDRFRILTHIDLVTQLVQPSSSNIQLYNIGHTLVVDNATDASGVLSIYDITGRTLQNASFKANGKTQIEFNYPTGMYMAKAANALGTVSKKIRINSTLP